MQHAESNRAGVLPISWASRTDFRSLIIPSVYWHQLCIQPSSPLSPTSSHHLNLLLTRVCLILRHNRPPRLRAVGHPIISFCLCAMQHFPTSLHRFASPSPMQPWQAVGNKLAARATCASAFSRWLSRPSLKPDCMLLMRLLLEAVGLLFLFAPFSAPPSALPSTQSSRSSRISRWEVVAT